MSLRQQVVSGLYWTGGARLVAHAITWIITIAVIRLLKPEDYGLMAMATIFTGLCMLLAEAGLGAALVQAKAISDDDERCIFGAAIIVHVLLFLGLIGAAPWIASFFAEERLTWILRVQSMQLLLSMFIVVPTALQTRQLNFKHQSIIGTLGAVFASVTTLLLALLGYGVWALVLGNLLGIGLVALGMNLVSPFLKRPKFSFLSSRTLLAFGGQVTAARVISQLYAQADIFIAGKVLGKELLGLYAVAMALAMLPISRLSSMLNQVAFPAFSRAQDDPSLVAPYLLKGVRMQCLVVFPLTWGISSVAPEIVTVLLGHGWQGAALPLQLLSLVMPLNALSYFFNAAFQGLGHARVVFSNVLTAGLIMPVSFLIGTVWGVDGLALSWVVAFPLVVILNLRRMLPLVKVTFRGVGTAIGPAAGAAGVMYITILLARNLTHGADAVMQLVALVATGIASYSFMTWKLNRAAAVELAEVMRFPLLPKS